MASPQVVALQQQITILEGQLSALKNASDTLDDAQQQIVALRQQLDASRAQLSAAQADDAADKAAIASLQQQLAAAQADDAADEATIADLRAQLAAVTPPVVEPPSVEQPPVVEPPVVEPPSDPNAILTVLDFGGHHWTFGDLRPTGGKDRAIVMDGTPLAGGYASGYWSDGATLYVVTESRSWWKLDGTGFAQVASDPRAPVAPPATPGTPSEPAKSVVVPGLNGWTFSVEHANSAQRREGYDRLVTIQGWGSNGYADWLVTDGVNAYLHSGDLDIWQKFVPSPDWHWETCADPRGPDAPALPPVDDGVNRDLSTLKGNFARLLHKPCYPGNTDSASRRDDSGFNYFREAQMIPWFGGAHGGGQETNIFAFGLKPDDPNWLKWHQLMPATPVGEITIANFDRVHGYFKTTEQPGARHSYPGVFGKGRKIYCTQARAMPDSYGDFTPSPPAPRIWGGEYWNYDLDTGKFTYSDKWADRAGENTEPLRPGQQPQPHYFAFAACYDDVTGNILEADTALRMYVPETDDYIFGPSTGIGSINGHCVDRCPENDRFYLFSIADAGGVPGPIRVFETTPDRSNFANWKTKPIAYSGAQPMGLYSKRERMRWDARNRVFCGYFDQGKARVYDCLGVYGAPHKMYEVAMQLEAPIVGDPPSLSFHCHDYIPEHDIHVFVDVPAYLHGDPRTWAFRLDMKTAIPAPAPVIPDGMTLQAVLDHGGTITLNPGVLNDSGKITKAGTVLVGNATTLQGGGVEVEGKGILLVDASSTIQGVTFKGAAVSDGNGAGIRQSAGSGLLNVNGCTFDTCQNGYLGNADVAFDGCDFIDDGKGDGQTHAVYVSDGAKLATANACTFSGTKIGHHFKSRAAKTVLTACTMEAATESYSANFPWGGVVEMSDCEITEGADTDNPKIISYGEESPAFTENSITLTRMTLTSSRQGSIGIYVDPRIAAVPMVLTDVHFVGVPFPIVGATNVTYVDCTKDGAPFSG